MTVLKRHRQPLLVVLVDMARVIAGEFDRCCHACVICSFEQRQEVRQYQGVSKRGVVKDIFLFACRWLCEL